MIGEISSTLMLIVLPTLGFLSATMLILMAQGIKAGAVTLIFAVLSLGVGGGFLVGFILGVVGGVLTLAGQ